MYIPYEGIVITYTIKYKMYVLQNSSCFLRSYSRTLRENKKPPILESA